MQTPATPVQALRAMGVVPLELDPGNPLPFDRHDVPKGWAVMGTLDDQSTLFLFRGDHREGKSRCVLSVNERWRLYDRGMNESECVEWWPLFRRCVLCNVHFVQGWVPFPVFLSPPEPDLVKKPLERKKYLTLTLLCSARSLPQNPGCAFAKLPREMVREIAKMIYT